MPWQIEPRDGRYCVVKEGASDPVPGGCHERRVDAVKHQRALYANEARVAAIYEKLDEVEQEAATESAIVQEIRVVLEQPEAVTAALVLALELVAERLADGDRTTEALTAALQAAGSPTIVVEPTPISVAAPNVTVQAPNVTVQPQIMLPADRRAVSFERDRAGRITGAVVEEG